MSHAFHVFLSHNSKDKPIIREIARLLREQGLSPWLDEEQLIGGGQWQDRLARGVRDSATCAMFIGSSNLGNWQQEELYFVQNRAADSRDYRLIPVLLPGLKDPFDTSLIPPFLQSRTWVDLRHGVDDPRAMHLLVCSINGTTPGPRDGSQSTGANPATGITPYLGLETFDEASAQLFFGREADVQRLVEKLKASNFLAVIGASGSGKSSLVRAGLIPALRSNELAQSGEWSFVVLRPGSQPISELAIKLLRLVSENYGPADLSAMEQELRQNESGLYKGIILQMSRQGLSPEQERRRKVVIVVDQFEEIFTLCQDEAERRRFLDNLLYASAAQDNRCLVILTMRADFYHKCLPYEGLAARMSAHQYGVGPMSDENLREAIEGPARLVGVKVEPELLDRMIEEVRNQPGSLPLLEYALLEVWKRRSGNTMTLLDYEKSGGVKEALAKKAESIFSGMSAERQKIVMRLMLRLTQPGQGTEDTRRRATLSELSSPSDSLSDIEAVVGEFTDARLLTMSRDDREPIVDVSHEALIRGWPKLRNWVDEDRAGLLIQHRLAENAKEWISANRDQELLYRGKRLQEALDWQKKSTANLSAAERDFLETSERSHQSDRTKRRVTFSVIGVAAVVLISYLSLLISRVYSDYKQDQEKKRVIEAMQKDFIQIPGGVFVMGSTDGEEDEKPPHSVTIQPFEIGQYEVTQKQWWAVMGDEPSSFKGDDLPVEGISWWQAKGYCEKLSALTGKTYRLPTEAEWEYAARGGTTTEYSFGDDKSMLGEYAWFRENAGGETHPVGQKKPNPFGLYDMHGNVWEWVEDHYHENYVGAPTDGSAWLTDDDTAYRVLRGGSWYDVYVFRSAYRINGHPDIRNYANGFRVVVGAQTQRQK
jgi:formylglycine-generating enzyme required for sulfatase activity/energy-coupling factor transporter ATP-binding protein EcfA2